MGFNPNFHRFIPPMYRTLHLSLLNFMRFLPDHFSSLSRSVWIAAWSSVTSTTYVSATSSYIPSVKMKPKKILGKTDVYNNHIAEVSPLKWSVFLLLFLFCLFCVCNYLLLTLCKNMCSPIKLQLRHSLKKMYFQQKIFTMWYKNTEAIIILKKNENLKQAIT